MNLTKRDKRFRKLCERHNYFSIITNIALTIVLALPMVNAAGITKGQSVKLFAPLVKPGEYVWQPELAPTGPVVIVVNLPEQLLYVYRNGVRIGRTTISSGKAGHRTPTGIFIILQKSVAHTSTIYKGASMPYMERLTWGGVAIHAGNLPGYPAAHGCVRLPLDFAKRLYTITTDGTMVIVSGNKTSPDSSVVAGFLFDAKPSANEATSSNGIIWRPQAEPTGPVSIIVSRADHTVYVYRNGVEIGRAPVSGVGYFDGIYVYSALADVDSEGQQKWFSSRNEGSDPNPNLNNIVKQVSVNPQFLDNVRQLLVQGTTLILTNAPVNFKTQSSGGFNIITTGE